MSNQLNSTITQSSKQMNPQNKFPEPIILKEEIFDSSFLQASSKYSPQKKKLLTNDHHLRWHSSDYKNSISEPIEFKQTIQNQLNLNTQNTIVYNKTSSECRVNQNLSIATLQQKQVRSISANSNSYFMNLSKQIQPKTKFIQHLVASDPVFGSKHEFILPTTIISLPLQSLAESESTSMIKKQNEIEISCNNQLLSQQSICTTNFPTFLDNHIQVQQLSKEEEEKEGFCLIQELDNKIEEFEDQITFQKKNNMLNKSILGEIEVSQPKLLPSFYDILGNDITLKIANFLEIRDFIKLATLSRQSRNFVAKALRLIDYSISIEEHERNKVQEYSTIENLQKIQKYFNSFPKKENFEKEFLAYLEKKTQKEYIFFAILKAGINESENKILSIYDLISHFEKQGTFNCFSDINLPFVSPSKLKAALPAFFLSKNNLNEQFLKVILNYVALKYSNKASIENQIKASKKFELFKIRNKFMKNKLKLQAQYVKQLLKLKKNSKFFDFVNINTLQNIIKFLSVQEICILLQSGKTVREVVKQAVQHQLSYLESQREQQLLSLGLSPQFGRGILYAKQFKQFSKEEASFISSERFSFAPLCEQIKAICFAVTSQTLEGVDSQFSFDQQINYKIKLKYSIPNPKRLQLINSFLENYPTLKDFKQKRLNDKNISPFNERGCILLYQTMKGYQILSQFSQNNLSSFAENHKVYTQKISPLDIIIFKYLGLLGKNEDELFMLPKIQSVKKKIFIPQLRPLFPN